MTQILSAGSTSAIVTQDVRHDTMDALLERMETLRAALDSGDLSPADRANAAATLAQLESAYHDVSGYTATVDEVARAADLIGRADSIVETADAELFGEPIARDRPALDRSARWFGPSAGMESMVSDGAALRDLFESDPQSFAAQWRELSSEDRQLAMFSLQQEVAMDNQITQMLTGLMKSSHDTAMAVARNLQV